jgi:transcriptional regulator of acetoin/glycerol metabolism
MEKITGYSFKEVKGNSCKIIKPETQPINVKNRENNPGVKEARKPLSLNKKKILDLLYDCEWNKAEVARRVGLSRATIWKYMKKWDIPMQP